MAFTDSERNEYEKLAAAYVEKRRPPEELRHRVDIGFGIANQSIVIYEIRPPWSTPGEMIEFPVAKTTFVRKRNRWKIYWMRRDLKWHSYPAEPEVKSPERFFEVIEEDSFCCFWG
jgi:hypothetical protein